MSYTTAVHTCDNLMLIPLNMCIWLILLLKESKRKQLNF